MSVHVISWVLQHSPAEHSDRLVLIVLADHAQADGTGAYPALETVQREARLGARSTVQRALGKLEAAGHIRRTGQHPKGMAIWQVMMDNADAFFRLEGGASGVLGVSPEPGGPQDATPSDSAAAQGEIGPEPSLGTVQQQRESLPREDGSTDGSGSRIGPPEREKWKAIRAVIEAAVSPIAFHNFIDPLELVELSESSVVLSAPAHALTSVQSRYLSKLTAAARAELGEHVTVEVRPSEPMREVS